MSKKKILIVEDNTFVSLQLEYILKQDYEVHTATDGSTAVDMIQTYLQPDAIITDISMPGYTGWELLSIVKAKFSLKHIPVLVLTAGKRKSNFIKGIQLGASDFMTKPFTSSYILSRVQELVNRAA